MNFFNNANLRLDSNPSLTPLPKSLQSVPNMNLSDKFLADLRQILSPSQIVTDPDQTNFYAQDWSQTLTPKSPLTLFPETTEQVSRILKTCSKHSIQIIPSGGRTGLSGGAVATQGEVILSLTRLNFIRNFSALSQTVEAGAGAITQAVHEFCEPYGLTWPVDFASKGSSTVGGNISTNAGGIRVLRYGSTRNWVLGITAVTMDGTIHCFNENLEKNNTGIDFRHLLIGSEGTLAVVTEAVLKLAPLPKSRNTFLCNLESFETVIHFYSWLKNFLLTEQMPYLSAFECFDSACFTETLKHFQMASPLPSTQGLFVLFEVENVPESALTKIMGNVLVSGFVLDAVFAQNETEYKKLWSIREGIAEAILHGHTVHQQDVSVPQNHLGEFYSKIQERYAQAFPNQGVYFFGHIGDGNLHIFIRTTPADLPKLKQIDLELFEILKTHKGSVSAEHGIGLLKKHALGFTRSPLEIELMKKTKTIWDPSALLNPGKVF